MNNLYNRIEELCAKSNIKIGKMCAMVGIQRSVMSDLKSGRKNTLSAETLSKIASYFDTTVDYLIGKTDTKKAPSEDEAIEDEFVGFYGDVKKDLTEGDINDIKKLMELRAELNKNKEKE